MAQQLKKQVTVTWLPPTYSYRNRWAVSGSAATPYTISEAKDGNWACSCMAWTRTTPREDCKHILRVKLQQMKPQASAPAVTVASTPSLAIATYTGRKMR
jgi:hypothetical protein